MKYEAMELVTVATMDQYTAPMFIASHGVAKSTQYTVEITPDGCNVRAGYDTMRLIASMHLTF